MGIVLRAQDSSPSSNGEVTPPARANPQPSGREKIARPDRVRISQSALQSYFIKRVNPKYPKDARKLHIQGMVLFKVIVSKDGDILEANVLSGDPLLVPAAAEGVKQWKCRPYLLNGEPVEIESRINDKLCV